jgi:hypothetical protein
MVVAANEINTKNIMIGEIYEYMRHNRTEHKTITNVITDMYFIL